MSIDNGTCHLSFPLRGEIPTAKVLVLRDVDVVGVGALRRHQLLQMQNEKEFILWTHEDCIPPSVHAIYQAELLLTLQWLRPVKTEPGPFFDFQKDQRTLFGRIFPETQKALGFTASKVCDSYLAEMDWSSWLLQDHWRYFVGFLRQKFPENIELKELAHWEWVKAWLEIQPFEASQGEAGIVNLNPSLQIVPLTQRNSLLERDQGVYGFVYSEAQESVVERPLDVYDAKIIDLLQEDRKYTPAQLVEMAALSDEITTQLSSVEWEKRFLSLSKDAIIISNSN